MADLLGKVQDFRVQVGNRAGELQNQVVALNAEIVVTRQEVDRLAAERQQRADRELGVNIASIFCPFIKLFDELANVIQTGQSTEASLDDANRSLGEKSAQLAAANAALSTSDLLGTALTTLSSSVQGLANTVTVISGSLNSSASVPAALFVTILKTRMQELSDSLS
ncbi:hypothetical protein ACGFX8_33715 [Streptomyces sp. NPDC048362]|uniref:hypothetical protein n=1 Tax=Streptomyces sp. NPDC048362 TaxID=3365539 RepID=UPI00371E9A9E